MANMSYCKMQNTLLALISCESTMSDLSFDKEELMEHLSEDEYVSMKRLINLCKEISENFEDGWDK